MKNFLKNGFTLVEVIVSIAIFLVLGIAIFYLVSFVMNETRFYREKAMLALLANHYIEVVRNLPYSHIGTLHGSTCEKEDGSCLLPDLAEPLEIEIDRTKYHVYYSVSYVDDPADGTILQGTDPAPNDYKQVKVYVKNLKIGLTKEFSTFVAPSRMESLGNRGAIFIKVFDAMGQPVPYVSVQIINDKLSPVFNVTRTTDQNGTWLEIGVKPDINSYHIIVWKDGYSKDFTSPITEENPHPVKPHATVLVGEVTEISFSIDKLSEVSVSVLNQNCQGLAGIDFRMRGQKLIGESPLIYKFDKEYRSDSTGRFFPKSDTCTDLKCLEWDTYSIAPSENNYLIYGYIPSFPLRVLPDTSQEFSLMLGPYSQHSLLIIVKDKTTGNTIEGASVKLEGPVKKGPLFTGGSVLEQSNWSEASEIFNLSTAEIPYALRLLKIDNQYVDSGWLISSTFDTGTDKTQYNSLEWDPVSQPAGTEIKFQIATNNDNESWEFLGPDGTPNTYYTSSANTINPIHNNQRYFRYKVFFSTTDPSITPVLSNFTVHYISGCFTPGQVIFTNLLRNLEGAYRVTIEKEGYETQTVDDLSIDGSTLLEVWLNPL